MKIKHAQICIAAVFLFGLLCNSFAILVTYLRGSIFADNVQSMLQVLLAAYSGPLAIIIAGFFGQGGRDKDALPSTLWLAITVTVIWNVFLLWPGIGLVSSSYASSPQENAIDEFSSYVTTISAAATFLVSGALTYFFAKQP